MLKLELHEEQIKKQAADAAAIAEAQDEVKRAMENAG